MNITWAIQVEWKLKGLIQNHRAKIFFFFFFYERGLGIATEGKILALLDVPSPNRVKFNQYTSRGRLSTVLSWVAKLYRVLEIQLLEVEDCGFRKVLDCSFSSKPRFWLIKKLRTSLLMDFLSWISGL